MQLGASSQPEDLRELAASRAVMPAWIAEPVSAMVANG